MGVCIGIVPGCQQGPHPLSNTAQASHQFFELSCPLYDTRHFLLCPLVLTPHSFVCNTSYNFLHIFDDVSAQFMPTCLPSSTCIRSWPHIDGWLIFDKNAKQFSEKSSVSTSGPGTIGIHLQNDKLPS